MPFIGKRHIKVGGPWMEQDPRVMDASEAVESVEGGYGTNWNDESLISLLFDFIDGHELGDSLFSFLQEKAQNEVDMGE